MTDADWENHIRSGFVGTDAGIREFWLLPGKFRRRCHCGCGKRSTHVGGNNGVGLISGCEWSIRRWVHAGNSAHRRQQPSGIAPVVRIDREGSG